MAEEARVIVDSQFIVEVGVSENMGGTLKCGRENIELWCLYKWFSE